MSFFQSDLVLTFSPTVYYHWPCASKSDFNYNEELMWCVFQTILIHLKSFSVENHFYIGHILKIIHWIVLLLRFLSERVLHPSKASLPKFCRIREAGWTHLYSIHIVSLLCNSINFLFVGQFYIWATSPSLKFSSDLIGSYHPRHHRCMYHVCLLNLHTFSNSLLACFPFKGKGQLASVTLAATADRCHPPKLPSDFPSKRKSLKIADEDFWKCQNVL